MNLISTLKNAGRKVEKSFTGEKTGESDILDTLKKEHEAVAELLKKLVDSRSAAERKSLFKKIKGALVPHVRAEEKVVYDAILAVRDKETKVNGEEGYIEHGLADKLLATLGKIENAMSPEFSAASKVLKEIVEHHVKEEERNVWADVRKNFSDDQRLEMNRRFEAAKAKVKVA